MTINRIERLRGMLNKETNKRQALEQRLKEAEEVIENINHKAWLNRWNTDMEKVMNITYDYLNKYKGDK